MLAVWSSRTWLTCNHFCAPRVAGQARHLAGSLRKGGVPSVRGNAISTAAPCNLPTASAIRRTAVCRWGRTSGSCARSVPSNLARPAMTFAAVPASNRPYRHDRRTRRVHFARHNRLQRHDHETPDNNGIHALVWLCGVAVLTGMSDGESGRTNRVEGVHYPCR